MKFQRALLISSIFVLIAVGIAGAAQSLLDGTTIPKFMDPLPVAGDISVVNATPNVLAGIPSTPSYKIHAREFKAQILPEGMYNPSWVWGYLTDDDLDPRRSRFRRGIRPSYLGPVVVAQRGTPAHPTYLNELPPLLSVVRSNLPIDMTLDWANPQNIDCLPDANGNYTNPVCGLLPYQGLIPTAYHIHGGEVPPKFDGGPDSWTTLGNLKRGPGFPGNRFTYPNGQEEATIWFHPHAFGITRLNVYAGMAGVYILKDPDPANAPQAEMPHFPEYDIPLIIQDRSFDISGQLFYNLASNPQPNPTVHPFWIPEFIGDTIVVNGKTWPYLEVEPRQYRFRLLNGSNARFYKLSLDNGAPFLVVATDDGYLKKAVSKNNLIIAPGERYEVIVDFSGLSGNIIMKNSARTPFPDGARVTMGSTDTVMQFRVNKTFNLSIPNTTIAAGTVIRSTPLRPIVNAHDPATGSITRQLTLNEVIGIAPDGTETGPLELVLNNSKYNLNNPGVLMGGCSTPICRETELPAVGDTEIWEIINITADAHPMHLHLTSFQLLDRTPFANVDDWILHQYEAALSANGVDPGEGPPNPYNVKNADGAIGGNPAVNLYLDMTMRQKAGAYERGWKDTVIAYPGEVTRIVVRWAPQDIGVNAVHAGQNKYPFDPTELINGVGYVWHCHILDHEDNEMMRTYVVGWDRQPVFDPM